MEDFTLVRINQLFGGRAQGKRKLRRTLLGLGKQASLHTRTLSLSQNKPPSAKPYSLMTAPDNLQVNVQLTHFGHIRSSAFFFQ